MLSPVITRRLLREFANRDEPDSGPPAPAPGLLTGREHEVLLLVAEGLSNAEIAERLRVSLATVKSHVSHLLTKVGARDRTQLVIAAYEAGLVRSGAARP
jgi:DNA-binding NarL/FixJ family response regulator